MLENTTGCHTLILEITHNNFFILIYCNNEKITQQMFTFDVILTVHRR